MNLQIQLYAFRIPPPLICLLFGIEYGLTKFAYNLFKLCCKYLTKLVALSNRTYNIKSKVLLMKFKN